MQQQPVIAVQNEPSQEAAAAQSVHTKNSIIQCKYSIGSVDDPLETEADAVADQVVRMPENAVIQRKCAECEEEEKVQRKPLASFIQKKGSEGGSMVSEAITQQISNSRGSGSHMDNHTQSFMESRFGTDFPNVNIHTGNEAIQLSRELNAQAFTVGNDIYFNEGKYNPSSDSGKHLLAHELTHTVQQGGYVQRQIQRTGNNEFVIEGLEATRSGIPNFVFFEFNKPDNATAPQNDIEANERSKIVNCANANPGGLQLNGFASEEGVEAGNNDLVNRRIQAVSNVLRTAPINYSAVINTTNNLSLSRNHYDYRFWRTVEILPLGGTSSRVTSTTRGIEPCSTTNINNTVIPARGAAINRMTRAVTSIDAFIANPTTNTIVGNALRFSFHSDTTNTAELVKAQLQASIVFLNGMMGILNCGTPDSVDCGNTASALTSSQSITLCFAFFAANRSLEERVSDLIHESMHGSSFGLNDRGYRHERVLPILNTRQALDNAESYAVLIEHLHSGTAPLTGPATPDTAANCGADEDMVKSTVAWAERWNTYAVFGLQQIYGQTENTALMQPHIQFHFGRSDRAAIAGILDKYLQMMNFFDGGEIRIECVDNTDPLYRTWKIARWQGRTVKICNQQLRAAYLNRDDKVKYIYGALTTDIFNIPENHRMSYPNLARAIKIFFWQVEG